VDDASDVTYTTTMNIGGRDISVLIDTGSSDLWATGQIPNSTPTNFTADVTYAQGDAGGYISIAPVQFAGYTIPDQAYINVTSGDPPSVDGLIGLGPYMGSTIRTTVGSPSADPVLNRIFAQNTSTPNFLSFILGRSSGPSQPFSGELTVGEVIQGFEKISGEVKNEVQVLPTSDSGDQHWALSLDTFTGPDGKAIPYTTTVPNESKPVAVLDSGFSLPQIPGNISDAIYGRVQGAQWLTTSPVGPVWQIPCEQELNISVTIGGKVYPIHPLDVSLEITINPDIPNICVGAFQPSTIGFSNAAQIFDMVLGMSFLRNTYTLINFGDFVDVNSSVTADPYIQLLSLTDPGQAHQDFVSTRLNNVDTTSDSQFALLPASSQQSS
ncbi:acid protease, partial [Sistotremastrum niveocremeum HHB9708]